MEAECAPRVFPHITFLYAGSVWPANYARAGVCLKWDDSETEAGPRDAAVWKLWTGWPVISSALAILSECSFFGPRMTTRRPTQRQHGLIRCNAKLIAFSFRTCPPRWWRDGHASGGSAAIVRTKYIYIIAVYVLICTTEKFQLNLSTQFDDCSTCITYELQMHSNAYMFYYYT